MHAGTLHLVAVGGCSSRCSPTYAYVDPRNKKNGTHGSTTTEDRLLCAADTFRNVHLIAVCHVVLPHFPVFVEHHVCSAANQQPASVPLEETEVRRPRRRRLVLVFVPRVALTTAPPYFFVSRFPSEPTLVTAAAAASTTLPAASRLSLYLLDRRLHEPPVNDNKFRLGCVAYIKREVVSLD